MSFPRPMPFFIPPSSAQTPPNTKSSCRWARSPGGRILKALLLSSFLWAVPLRDTIADPAIYTVQFYRGQNTLAFPYLGLNENQVLTLEFDELREGGASDFWVRIQLCNRHWEPSTLPLTEYWPAFLSDRITEFSLSVGTRVPYVHYRYQLRNLFQRSGFYVIEVFRDNDPARLVLRRRFYVVENVVQIAPDWGGQVVTGARQRFQSLSFKVYPRSLQSLQNYQELFCGVLQNGRWDRTNLNLRPTFLGQNYLEYRFQPGLDMEAGNEFRMLDLRSILRRRSFQVERTLWSDSGIVVLLSPERPRANAVYFSQIDLNGRFLIQVQDLPIDTTGRWAGRDELSATQADYFWVEFRLQADKYPQPVYVVGGFMGWSPDPRYELYYDEARGEYRRRIRLKQGVYDYLYALYDPACTCFRTEPLEGSYFETENIYLIVVGYRGFTDREDRVVGHRWIGVYE
jgi:hypothetical protein